MLVGAFPIGYVNKGTTLVVVEYDAWTEGWKSFKDGFVNAQKHIRGLDSKPFSWGIRGINPQSMISTEEVTFSCWLWNFIVSSCHCNEKVLDCICAGLAEKGLNQQDIEQWRMAIKRGEFPENSSNILPQNKSFHETFLYENEGFTPGELSQQFSSNNPMFNNLLPQQQISNRSRAPGFNY